MNLLEQINNDLKQAMRAKNEIKLSTLRMLKSQIKNQEIQKGEALANDDIIDIISKQIKQRKDSIAEYKLGKRKDLAKKEETEIQVLEPFLPEQLTDEKIKEIIDNIISSTGAKSMSDMGKIMGQVLAKTKGRADNSKIAQIVKSQLQ